MLVTLRLKLTYDYIAIMNTLNLSVISKTDYNARVLISVHLVGANLDFMLKNDSFIVHIKLTALKERETILQGCRVKFIAHIH